MFVASAEREMEMLEGMVWVYSVQLEEEEGG